MLSKQEVLNLVKQQGQADAADLRTRAKDMEPTALIAEEDKVPMFVEGADYSSWPVGSPIGQMVNGELQIFTMITPVNTANYPGITPNTERSLYSLCHTKDPKKAKAWIAPLGISGLYSKDECCTDADHVWRSNNNNNAYAPSAYPANWTDLGTVKEVMGT